MRAFRREEVISEITENDRVTHLEGIKNGDSAEGGGGGGGGVEGATKWAYGLANGEGFFHRCKHYSFYGESNTCTCIQQVHRNDV